MHLADGLVLEGEVRSPESVSADVALHALGVEHLVVGHHGVALDRLVAHRAHVAGFLYRGNVHVIY